MVFRTSNRALYSQIFHEERLRIYNTLAKLFSPKSKKTKLIILGPAKRAHMLRGGVLLQLFIFVVYISARCMPHFYIHASNQVQLPIGTGPVPIATLSYATKCSILSSLPIVQLICRYKYIHTSISRKNFNSSYLSPHS